MNQKYIVLASLLLLVAGCQKKIATDDQDVEARKGKLNLTAKDIRVDCGLKTGSNNGSSWDHAFQHLDNAVLAKAAEERQNQLTIAIKGNCVTSALLDISKIGNLRIVGVAQDGDSIDAMNKPVVSGNDSHPVFFADYFAWKREGKPVNVILENIKIQNGLGQATRDHGGGGMGIKFADSSMVIKNVDFLNNASSIGGGLAIIGASPQLINCSFKDNKAHEGGAIWVNSGQPTIIDGYFEGNKADEGGAISVSNDTTTIKGGSFIKNKADRLGGALYARESNYQITDVKIFSGNTESNQPNDIYIGLRNLAKLFEEAFKAGNNASAIISKPYTS